MRNCIILVLVHLLAIAGFANAECDILTGAKDAEAIFIGTVVSQEFTNDLLINSKVKFQIDTVYKSKNGSPAVVYSDFSNNNGYSFEFGQKYLVFVDQYASEDEDVLGSYLISKCTKTFKITEKNESRVEEALMELNPAVVEVTTSQNAIYPEPVDIFANSTPMVTKPLVVPAEFMPGNKFLIPNIFLDFKNEGKLANPVAVLDSLENLLRNNPQLHIEIGYHTDTLYSDNFNNNLSQERADVVRNSLIRRGIEEHRLTAIGYGETVKSVYPDNQGKRIEIKVTDWVFEDDNMETIIIEEVETQQVEREIIEVEAIRDPIVVIEDEEIIEEVVNNNEVLEEPLASAKYALHETVFEQSLSRFELEDLVDFLKENKEYVFEIGVHANSKGSEVYNLTYTDLRAKNIREQLIANGVQSNSLVSLGYGEEFPKEKCQTDNCTEDQHNINERITVKVLKNFTSNP